MRPIRGRLKINAMRFVHESTRMRITRCKGSRYHSSILSSHRQKLRQPLNGISLTPAATTAATLAASSCRLVNKPSHVDHSGKKVYRLQGVVERVNLRFPRIDRSAAPLSSGLSFSLENMSTPRASIFFFRGDFNPRPHGAFVRADLEDGTLAKILYKYSIEMMLMLRYQINTNTNRGCI